MPARPSYSAGKFAMELDGAAVGFVVSVEGGEPFAPVVEEPPVGVVVHKHVLPPRYAPLVVEVGASMAKPFVDWVAAMLDGTQTARDGAIVFLDYSLKVQSRLEWKAALITEVAFPAADGSSKEAAVLRITLQPEKTTLVGGSGASYGTQAAAKTSKSFLPSNFRFTISGLAIGNRIAKVAAVVVRGSVLEDDSHTHGVVSVGPLDVSDLVIWLPESDVQPLAMWFEDFVIKGVNDSSNERKASLAFLEPSLKDELMRLDFEGVGIHRISRERLHDSASVIARVKVEMYCEAVTLAKPAAPPPTAAPDAGTGAGSVGSLADAIVAALREQPRSTGRTPVAIAERLLASTATVPPADERQRGHDVGRKWASEHARLDELEAIAPLAERDDWTALALDEGHTLVTFLAASGELDPDETGPIDLEHDGFTTGLVAGAAEVYREVAPRLRERRQPDT